MNEWVVQEHVDSVNQQMKQLYIELSDLVPALQILNTQQKEAVFKKLSIESIPLMQSLHFLIK